MSIWKHFKKVPAKLSKVPVRNQSRELVDSATIGHFKALTRSLQVLIVLKGLKSSAKIPTGTEVNYPLLSKRMPYFGSSTEISMAPVAIDKIFNQLVKLLLTDNSTCCAPLGEQY